MKSSETSPLPITRAKLYLVHFAIIETVWGYEVAPAEQELWFDGIEPGENPRFQVTNLAPATAELEFPSDIARVLDLPSLFIRPAGAVTIDFIDRPGGVENFSFRVWIEGFRYRARAGSDPRIRIRP